MDDRNVENDAGNGTEHESLRSSHGVAGAAPVGDVPYQLFMFFLSVLVLGMLVAETFLEMNPETSSLFAIIDTVVCVVFLFDFIGRLITAPNRWKYMATWGWLDLVSALPTSSVMRLGRLARIVRLLRLLRGATTVQRILHSIRDQRGESTLLSAIFIAVLMILFGAVAILECERSAPGSTIHTASDAIWWAVVTMATVGYGDCVPVTGMGRLIGAVLMPVGIGLFATFSALLAAWLIRGRREAEKTSEIEHRYPEMKREIERLRTENRLLREIVAGKIAPDDDNPDNSAGEPSGERSTA